MDKGMMKRYLPSLGFVYLICLFLGAIFFVQWIRSPIIVTSTTVAGDVFRSLDVQFSRVSNFASLEGPYPQWNLPRVRWGLGPETRIEFVSDEAREVNMVFLVRTSIEDQEMEVSLNNKAIKKVHVRSDLKEGAFQEVQVKGVLRKGRNGLVLDYSRWKKDGEKRLAVLFSLVQIGSGDFVAQERAREKAIHKEDIFKSTSIEFGNFSGFRNLEGPYPKWKLPKVRWGLGPETNMAVISAKQREVNIVLWVRTHIKGQDMEIMVNDQPIMKTLVKPNLETGKFQVIDVLAPLKEGANIVTLKYSKWAQTHGKNNGPIAVLFSKIEIE